MYQSELFGITVSLARIINIYNNFRLFLTFRQLSNFSDVSSLVTNFIDSLSLYIYIVERFKVNDCNFFEKSSLSLRLIRSTLKCTFYASLVFSQGIHF